MPLSLKEATEQILNIYENAGVKGLGVPDLINGLHTRIIENEGDRMQMSAQRMIGLIIGDDKLKPHISEICEIVENMAPTQEKKSLLQETFKEIKASTTKRTQTKEKTPKTTPKTPDEIATEQILDIFINAGVKSSGVPNLISEMHTRIIENEGDRMQMSAQRMIGLIIGDDKLKPYISEICEIVENMAPTAEKKALLQKTFIEVKSAAHAAEQEQIKNSLDLVEETLNNLTQSDELKEGFGKANATKMANMVAEMNDQLKGTQNLGKRASIILDSLQKIDQLALNAEKQAEKSKINKVSKVIKASIKVVLTLGMSKSAKLEFSAAKFSVSNKNAQKIQKTTKVLSEALNNRADKVTNIQKSQSNKNSRSR